MEQVTVGSNSVYTETDGAVESVLINRAEFRDEAGTKGQSKLY